MFKWLEVLFAQSALIVDEDAFELIDKTHDGSIVVSGILELNFQQRHGRASQSQIRINHEEEVVTRIGVSNMHADGPDSRKS